MISPIRLEAILAAQLAKAKRRTGWRPDGGRGASNDTSSLLRVVIRADRRQRFGRLGEILAACQRAGITHVVPRGRKGRPQ